MSKLIKILVIEDSMVYQKAINDMFLKMRRLTAEIVSADSLHKAEPLLQNSPSDLILLDLNLSDSLGLLSLKKLKTFSGKIPIIVLTADDCDDTAISALANGAGDYLLKSEINYFLLERSILYVIERNKFLVQLNQKSEFYKNLFNDSMDAVFVENENNEIIDVNQSFEELFGYKLPEIKGNQTSSIYPEKQYTQNSNSRLNNQFHPAGIFRTIHYRKKGGDYFFGETGTFSIKNENSGEMNYASLIRDVTFREYAYKRLTERENTFRSIFKNAPIGINLVSKNGSFILVNEKFQKIIGYSEEELKNMHFRDYTHPEDADDDIKIFNKLVDGKIEQYSRNKRYITKNKEIIYCEITVSSVKGANNEFQFAIGMLIDITDKTHFELKLNESEMKHQTEMLEIQKIAKIAGFNWDLNTQKIKWTDEFFRIIEKEYQPQPFTPENFYSFIHFEDVELVKISIEWYIQGKSEFPFKFRLLMPDDRIKWVSCLAKRILNTEDLTTNIIGYIQDISEKEKYECYKSLSNDILGVLNTPNNSIDIIRHIILIMQHYTTIHSIGIRLKKGEDYPYYTFSGFSNYFILKENSLVARDKHCKIIVNENSQAVLECMCGTVIRGNYDAGSPHFTKKGSFWTNSTTEMISNAKGNFPPHTRNYCNKEGYESVALIPIKNVQETIGLIQLNDKNKNKFTLEDVEFYEELGAAIGIALSRLELEETREKLMKELETSLQKSEKANFYKTEFLANMSHEIRTPLSGMIGFNDLLLMDDSLNNEQREALELMKLSGKRLLNLLNDILEISKIEANQISIIKKSFNIQEMLKDLISLFSIQIKSKRLSLHYHLENMEEIYTDPTRLYQVLINLTGNALKFTDNGKIDIAGINEGSNYLFSVKDTGIGVKEEYKDSIFNSFTIGETGYTKKYQGAGLGLAISKRLISLLGGEIWFESEYGKGTTFFFTIPFEDAESLLKNTG